MFVELKCKNCNSRLTPQPDGKIFVCEGCGSRFVYACQGKNQNYYQNSANSYLEEQRKRFEREAAERKRRIDEENEKERLRLELVEKRAYWIRNKLCRHCGGEFEGRIFKKCKNCGKSKDY